MAPPSVWGPPTWNMFHTFIENIKEEHFETVGQPLFYHIKQICQYLPCPECSSHATAFLSKVEIRKMKSKNDMRNLFYVFHNVVNKRKNKPLQNVEHLEIYSNRCIIEAFNSFVAVYNTKGNMNQLSESFQRKMILNNFKKWVMIHINCFTVKNCYH